jgi:uncharacterized membrane protein (DUF4010 family)
MLPAAEIVLPKLATAAALGLLVGLQRERAQVQVAALRTFTLIPVLACLLTLLAAPLGSWVPIIGVVALVALFILGNLMMPVAEQKPGITTEVAALVMFAVGCWLALASAVVPVVVTGCLVLLLAGKEPLHQLAHRIGATEFKGILQFVLIALVIWPVLPNQAYGPYQVLNPREIWLMVVLIVSISLGGYVLSRAFGAKAGTLLGGVLGGIISSTATTVSAARRTRASGGGAEVGTVVVMIASTIAFVRFVLLVAAVAPAQAAAILPPMAAMGGIMAVITLCLLPLARRGEPPAALQGNPAELKTALVFGGLYAVVILLVAVTNTHVGQSGLYLVAVVSGTTDMDAITLSAARLMDKGQIGPELGWRVILVAALANIAFKGGIAAVLGTRALAWRVALAFLLALLGGGAILWLW